MTPRWLAIYAAAFAVFAAAFAVSGCSNGPGEADSAAVVAGFHAALNAGDTPAINGLLSQSTRNLRPGIGTARAFGAITSRHGRYLGGTMITHVSSAGRTRIDWQARYENGPVLEQFTLVDEAGDVRIDSYTDNRQG